MEITTEGAVVSRLRIRNKTGFAIVVKADNVTIRECDIEGAVNLCGPVRGVRIQGNYIHGVSPEGDSNYKKQFAGVMTTEGDRWANPIRQPMGASDIDIRGNYLDDCSSGAYLVECKGPITFAGNYSRNHRGPYPRGQMLQLSHCDGTAGQILIENNFSYVDSSHPLQKGFHENGQYGAEDHVNIYATHGSEQFPVVIRGNYITGHSASFSGTAVMAGDQGGSYIHILENKAYFTGNAGIGLNCGHHFIVRGNRIWQSPAASQYDGRGLQIERFGDCRAPNLVEDNNCLWMAGRGDVSLYCTAEDVVTFRDNSFGDAEAFGPLDPMPPHRPPELFEGWIRPWEQEKAIASGEQGA